MSKKRSQAFIQFGLFCGIIIFINIIANFFHSYIDLTEEKRFTLTTPTKKLLAGVKDVISVTVLLEGDFPAGFKRLQDATREMLDDFRSETGYIEYTFEDPNKGSLEEVNERRKQMADDGINPVNLRVMEQGESTQKLIYPVAIFHFGERSIPVKLLENETPGFNQEEILNNSVQLLEYKFANAIKKLNTLHKPLIAFTYGHGELDQFQTADLEKSLLPFYETGRVHLDSLLEIKPANCALLIVAKPRAPFSDKDKFKIDQYVMQGGKVMWLIDRLNAELDSINTNRKFVPTDYPLNLEDLLFRYGVRVQPDLVVDMQCTKIPLQVGQLGNAPQFDLFDWYYHPAVSPASAHPVVKNLDRTELKFCSSIDTIKTKTPVRKTVLLASSKYSRLQFSPMEISFDILRYAADASKFNKGNQPVAVMLEGIFPSLYENRITEEMAAGMKQIGMEFKAQSVPTGMLVVSDGDVIANIVRDREKKQWLPLGMNRYEQRTYANKEFITNAIEYLLDANGVIEARQKEVKLRLLDTVKAQNEKGLWRGVNLGVPLLFLVGFGWFFNWRRKRKYA